MGQGDGGITEGLTIIAAVGILVYVYCTAGLLNLRPYRTCQQAQTPRATRRDA